MAIPKDVKIGERKPLSRKEWCKILDTYMLKRTMYLTDFERMNPLQIEIIKEISKSIVRLNKK